MPPVILPSPRPWPGKVLAVAGDLKCRPALAQDDKIILLPELGDLEQPENQEALEELLSQLAPKIIVCDRHPGYFGSALARDLAQKKGIPIFEVQHHRAHVAAVCLEHSLFDDTVVGLAFDGTGYGDDGVSWGGEFFVGSVRDGFLRHAHFAELSLPGGDAAVLNPWRSALARLLEGGASKELVAEWIKLRGVPLDELGLFQKSLQARISLGKSSALGRWFDLVSALLGVCIKAEFEAQPAIELQKMAEKRHSLEADIKLAFSIKNKKLNIIDFPDLDKIALCPRENVPDLALAFHVAVAEATAEVATSLAKGAGAKKVVASGGCFLNSLLDRLLAERLKTAGLEYIKPKMLPPGDQALAVGQIGLALAQMRG